MMRKTTENIAIYIHDQKGIDIKFSFSLIEVLRAMKRK